MRVQNQPRFMGALLIPPQRPTRGRSGSRRRGSGSCPGDLVDYTPTEPLLVVEGDADVCFEQERWRHWLPRGTGCPAACRPGFDLTAVALDVMWSGAPSPTRRHADSGSVC